MDLHAFVSRYLLEHALEFRSAQEIQRTAKQFSDWLGRPASLDDFTDETVSRWLVFLQESGQARETLRTKRRSLLTFWRAAFDEGLVLLPPRRVRKIKPLDTIPECWTHEQLSALLAQCSKLRGRFRKLALPRALYMTSLVNSKYDTALRLGDMQSIERNWIWIGGTLSIVQHKTGRSHRAQLRESTLAQIDELMAAMPKRRLIWPAFCGRRRFFRFFKQIIGDAGLHGSSKYIRRSSASYYEREHPGQAWQHLGHSCPGLDRRSYIDPRIAYPAPHLPPRIA